MTSFGGTIKLQGESEYKKALSEITGNLKVLNSEMKVVTSQYDRNDKSAESLSSQNDVLNKKIDEQQSKVDILTKALKEAEQETGENSATTKKWQIELNNAQAELNKLNKQVENNEEALKDLDSATDKAEKEIKDLGDTSEKTGGKLKSFLGGVGNVAKGFAVGVVGSLTGLATGLIAVTEESKEFNNNMAKLESSAKDGGYAVDYAKKGFQELYGVLADETGANTTMSNLMAIGTTTKNVDTLITASKGIWAKYGDSIPLDGLAEAVNHTSKLGSVQGNLADALEWSGITVDDFNAKLEKCRTEEERTQLIVDTLNKEYGKLGEEFEKNNEAMISLNEAQMNIKQSMAEIGEAFAPVLAMLTQFGAEVLAELVPYVQEFAEILSNISNGSLSVSDGISKMTNVVLDLATNLVAQLPNILQAGVGIVKSLLSGIQTSLPQIMPVVMEIITTLVNGLVDLLPQILQTGITILTELVKGIADSLPTLIPTVVDAVILMVETLIDNIDLIIDAGIQLILGLADGLIEALPRLIEKVPVIMQKLIDAFVRNFPKIVKAGGELIGKLVVGLIGSLGELLMQGPKIVKTLITGIMSVNKEIKNTGINLVKGIWEGISGSMDWIKNKIKGWVGNVTNFLKKLFGINSPSKLFKEQIGTNLALGVGEGFGDTMSEVSKDMANAIPTEFDTDVSLKANASTKSSGSSYDNMVGAFREALKDVKVVMNGREMGAFVESTMEKVVYS